MEELVPLSQMLNCDRNSDEHGFRDWIVDDKSVFLKGLVFPLADCF